MHIKRLFLRAVALLLTTAAYWPPMARADSYPAPQWGASTFPMGGGSPINAYGQSCKAAWDQLVGNQCHTGSRISQLLDVYEDVGSCGITFGYCRYQDDNSVGPACLDCGGSWYCPYGGAVSCRKCANAPSCPSCRVR